MELTGEQIIPQVQSIVWDGLNDPEVLKACITGCETIEKVSDTEFNVTILAAVGPVKARFKGNLLLSELNPPNSYSLTFSGNGGAAGFGKGGAQVTLSPEGAGTKLVYVAKAQVGGKLAQVGSRLIDGVAKKLAEDFFKAFNAKVAGPAVAAEGSAAAAPAGDKVATTEPFNPLWFVLAAVAGMFALTYFV
jgi:carbon monoxide dehydrogenase subunit G